MQNPRRILRFHFHAPVFVQTAAFGVSPTVYLHQYPLSACRVDPLLEPLLHCNGGSEGCIVDNGIPLPSNL